MAAVILLTSDPAPEPPAGPSGASGACLARQLAAAARHSCCPGPIRPDSSTRCEFLYPDGDTQLMLVTLSRRGELEIEVPYPAQRRPAD